MLIVPVQDTELVVLFTEADNAVQAEQGDVAEMHAALSEEIE